MKMNEAIEEFLTYMSAEKGDSATTIKAYENDMKDFASFIGEKDTDELTGEDFSDFIAVLSEKGLKKSSITRKYMCVRQFYGFLKTEKHLSIVMKDLSMVKNERKLPVVLSEEEIDLLFAQCDLKTYAGLLDRAMMELSYTSGLRVSETVLLRQDNLSLKGGYVKIRGKGKKERIVPLALSCQQVLTKYLEVGRMTIKTRSPLFFLHHNGKEVSRQYFYLQLKKYCDMAHIEKKISPHTLRHSCATRLIENGASLKDVQALLGHSQIVTTQIYTHISRQKEMEEYEKAMKR